MFSECFLSILWDGCRERIGLLEMCGLACCRSVAWFVAGERIGLLETCRLVCCGGVALLLRESG